MKKIIKSLQLSLIAAGFLFLAGNAKAQTISSHFFGQNAWMPDSIGNTYYGGKLQQLWPDIKASNPALIRFGGIGADREMPTHSQFLKMIDAIRSNGMEPTLQIPFDKWKFTAQQAADLVKFINVTSGRHIKYWSIGNEPDLGYSYTTSSQVASYVKSFATAMKNVDPTILIMGPETAWFNTNIINGLTTPNGPDDVTGKDMFGRYYLDIISFHSYGFDGTQTRAHVISKLTETGSLQDNLIYLNGRIAACNAAHNRTGTSMLKTAITEANIDWQNAAGDNLYGVGANSFIGGQYWAEMMGVAMKQGVDFVNFWSVNEGSGSNTNIGYIESNGNVKKPTYHHFKLMADNFRGNYVNGTTNKANVKSFGSQDGQQISVLILNQDQAAGYNYKVKLNTSAITASTALNININANVNVEYSDMIQSQSTVLLVFNSAGALIKKYEYSLNGNAASNQPPTLTQYIATNVQSQSNGEDTGPEFEISKAFPNPTSAKINIQLNKSNTDDREYQMEVFDMAGRLVVSRKAYFKKGTEELDLSSSSLASAMYIVRVKYEDILKTTKIMLIK
jgi:hypothetical protein